MLGANLELFPTTNRWECRARAAALGGRSCGHVNAGGIRFNGLVCCEGCGCTKVASDDRAQRESEARR